jgi:hypothetical protein
MNFMMTLTGRFISLCYLLLFYISSEFLTRKNSDPSDVVYYSVFRYTEQEDFQALFLILTVLLSLSGPAKYNNCTISLSEDSNKILFQKCLSDN